MDRQRAKRLLLTVAEMLDNLHLPFFLIQGTALGAYRDGGFTPTEKDIDLGVLQEHFNSEKIYCLLRRLNQLGYDVECFAAPFRAPRTVVVWDNDAKLDLVGWTQWKDKRFSQTPIRTWTENYALVHEACMLEFYRTKEMFGYKFSIPYDIRKYLELEYGPDWPIPKEDHVSRTRVYNFMEKEGVPNNLLG